MRVFGYSIWIVLAAILIAYFLYTRFVATRK